MRHDRIRAGVLSRVACDVPWVDVGQAEVDTIGFDEQRRYHAALPFFFGAVTFAASSRSRACRASSARKHAQHSRH
jgi:hypothetical protein